MVARKRKCRKRKCRKHKWRFKFRGGALYWFECAKCGGMARILQGDFWGGK